MIDIVRFDHISMAAPALDPQVELLERLFGFRLADRFENDEGYVGATLHVPGDSRLAWEVLAPNGPGSYLHRFLEGASGPGLHHVTLEVRDAEQAAVGLRAEGLDPWGERRGDDTDDSREVLYIHPRSGGHGLLYQLYAGEGWAAAEPFRDEGEHTLGVIAVDHVSHAHPDREELGDWYERMFGLETVYRSPGDGLETGFRTRVLELPTHQRLRVEVIAPTAPASFIQRFLDRRGPGLHHVTFEVDDWERAIRACVYHGVPVFGERAGVTEGVAWREAFIHPRHTGGMLVQFFWQAAPGAWI